MGFSVRVLADSIAPCDKRLTTLEARYPRCIHPQVLTHRWLSRNSASSRAIPARTLIEQIVDDPFVPEFFGKERSGMVAGEPLSEREIIAARWIWLEARDYAARSAEEMINLGVHKQIVNRLLEPFMWITVIISATEWDNWFGVRLHDDTEPHTQKLAQLMYAAIKASTPKRLREGEWHLPLVDIDGDDTDALDARCGRVETENFSRAEDPSLTRVKIAVGRCARVSYLTHDGRRDLEKDLGLHDRLLLARPLHASPAEHVARALASPDRIGNFIGWHQYRKMLPYEHIDNFAL